MRTVLFLLSLLYPLHLVWTASPLTPPRSPQTTQRSIAQVLNEFDLDNFVSLLCKRRSVYLICPVNASLSADCRQMLISNLTSLENLLLYQVLSTGGFTTDNFINNMQPQSVANFSTLQGAKLPITLHKNSKKPIHSIMSARLLLSHPLCK
eukprot:jgi/Galph1/2285/GphlegSOOS_G965.1